MKKKTTRARALLKGYLEEVDGTAMERHADFFRAAARGENGVYALYSGQELYYVGLARSLSARLKQHLKDRHKGAWDGFSMYLTASDAHMRELEALLIRIANPPGNRVSGRLAGARDLKRELKRWMQWRVREEERKTFRPRRERRDANSTDRPLRKSFMRATTLRGIYKGKAYRARLLTNGAIVYQKTRYDTPTDAVRAAIRTRKLNGWWFWKYERAPGDWVRLRNVRER
jgi:hypothetical protein